MPQKAIQKLKLTEIGYDPKFYPRANGVENWLTVHQYTEALTDPKYEFPPIVVVRSPRAEFKFMVIDGLHRIRTYARVKRLTIPAIIERVPESKWFARSVELNSTHGRSFDVGDKAFIGIRLESDGWSDGRVAKLLHMKLESLQKIKVNYAVKLTQSAAKKIKVGRGNRKVNGDNYGILKAPFTDLAGTASATKALAVQSPVSLRSVTAVLDSAIAVLQSGIVDPSDEEVASRLLALKGLIEGVLPAVAA